MATMIKFIPTTNTAIASPDPTQTVDIAATRLHLFQLWREKHCQIITTPMLHLTQNIAAEIIVLAAGMSTEQEQAHAAGGGNLYYSP